VAQGCRFMHWLRLLSIRALYVLPNGDVLVVESNGPKAPISRPRHHTGW